MKVTVAVLQQADACPTHLRRFAQEWPDGAEVTLDNVLRALELRLSLEWFVNRFFTYAARAAYDAAIAPSGNEYMAAVIPAESVFFKTLSAAHAVLIDAQARIQDEFTRVLVPLKAVVEREYAALSDTNDSAAILKIHAEFLRNAEAATADYERAMAAAGKAHAAITAAAKTVYDAAVADARAAHNKARAEAFIATFELANAKPPAAVAQSDTAAADAQPLTEAEIRTRNDAIFDRLNSPDASAAAVDALNEYTRSRLRTDMHTEHEE